MPATDKTTQSIKHFRVELPPDTYRSIKIICAAEGLSLAEFGRQAVNDRIVKHRKSNRQISA